MALHDACSSSSPAWRTLLQGTRNQKLFNLVAFMITLKMFYDVKFLIASVGLFSLSWEFLYPYSGCFDSSPSDVSSEESMLTLSWVLRDFASLEKGSLDRLKKRRWRFLRVFFNLPICAQPTQSLWKVVSKSGNLEELLQAIFEDMRSRDSVLHDPRIRSCGPRTPPTPKRPLGIT